MRMIVFAWKNSEKFSDIGFMFHMKAQIEPTLSKFGLNVFY